MESCRPTTLVQGGSALLGTAFGAGAVAVAILKVAVLVTPLALPILLGVGSLIAWVVFTATTVHRCRQKSPELKPPFPPAVVNPQPPKPPKSPIPVDPQPPGPSVVVEPQPSVKVGEDLVKKCDEAKKAFYSSLEGISREDVEQVKTVLEMTFESIEEIACGLTDPQLVKPLLFNFKDEIDRLNEVVQGLKEGRENELLHLKAKLLELLKHPSPQIDLEIEKLGGPNIRINPLGDTILHLVAKKGRPLIMIKTLAECGADFNVQDTCYGNTPLMWAIANANNAMAVEICHIGKTDLNIQDKLGRNTALLLAIGKGHKTVDTVGKKLTYSNFALVQELVKAGADVNLADNKGMTPLALAVIRADVEMVKFLLSMGAKKESRLLELLNLTNPKALGLLKEQVHVFNRDLGDFEANQQKIRALIEG